MPITKATASSIAPAAKGDLVVGSATNDAAVLGVGANDTVLTADSSTATGLKWATPSGASYRGVSLFDTTSQAIPNATDTIMTFNSESWDTDGFHSTSSNTSRITIPAGLGGKYLVVMNTLPENLSATGARAMELYKNGSRLIICNSIEGSATAYVGLFAAFVVNLVATDYLEMMIYQDRGAATNFSRAANQAPFSATYLGA
jgi:hypothetical protein